MKRAGVLVGRLAPTYRERPNSLHFAANNWHEFRIMLTQRSRYALRAMLFLATQPAGGKPVPMNRIANEANVPRKFLELILADLREAGFLHSHRGKMGGYCLSRPTHLISLGEIIRVIEGPLALVPSRMRSPRISSPPEANSVRPLFSLGV